MELRWLHCSLDQARETIKEKSFNWLQTSPQILPHQRMFTIMLEPSPGTQKNPAQRPPCESRFFVAAKATMAMGKTREDVMQGRRQTVLLE